jgi:hypothetical protein
MLDVRCFFRLSYRAGLSRRNKMQAEASAKMGAFDFQVAKNVIFLEPFHFQ